MEIKQVMLSRVVYPIIAIIIIFFSVEMLQAKTGHSIVSAKLEKVSKQFNKIYKLHPELPSPSVIAVLKFQCNKKLAEQRVGIAVSELLTHHLSENKLFIIVERMKLDKVIMEQSFGETGLVKGKTAVKLGELLGAQLLVMGNVARIGNSYQIAARIVNAETGEVILTELIEVDIKVFEEAASGYLNLVPEKQAVGLFFISGGSKAIDSKTISASTVSGSYGATSYEFDVIPGPDEVSNFPVLGLGVRYFPFKWLMTEGSYQFKGMYSEESEDNGDFLHIESNGVSLSYRIEVNSTTISSNLNGVYDLNNYLRFYGGAGIEYHFISYEVFIPVFNMVAFGADGDSSKVWINCEIEEVEASEGNSYEAYSATLDRDLLATYIQAGIEWRPQSRIGLAMFLRINITEGKLKPLNLKLVGRTGPFYYDSIDDVPIYPSTIEVFDLYLPRVMFNTTFSFYF